MEQLEELQEKGRVAASILSLSEFSDKTSLIISVQSDVTADAQKVDPALIFELLGKEAGIKYAMDWMLAGRKFEFDAERAVFLTVLHWLMVTGSDRFCCRWCQDYTIDGIEGLDHPHHLYRAIGFLCEEVSDQNGATNFSSSCKKDLVEEIVFSYSRGLFTNLDLIYFATTSIYFEGRGGESICQRAFSKNHRPYLAQMMVDAIIDDKGQPVCCEILPGNTADITMLLSGVEMLKESFIIDRICIVGEGGMISAKTIAALEASDNRIP